MVIGKHKGSFFENLILKHLRKIDSKCFRTVASGSSNFDKGDIVFKDFLVECKHHDRLTKQALLKVFVKLKREALDRNLIPVMIFRENYRPVMVAIEGDLPGVLVFYYFDDWVKVIKKAIEEMNNDISLISTT